MMTFVQLGKLIFKGVFAFCCLSLSFVLEETQKTKTERAGCQRHSPLS